MRKVTMIDPPHGWRYGFPKPLTLGEGQSLQDWLIENGYAPEIEGDLDDMGSRRDFGATFAATFAASVPRLTLSRRRKRSYNDDFHDRFVEIDIRHVGGAVKRHELTIGRGLEALYNDRRQCTVTYAPPGSA